MNPNTDTSTENFEASPEPFPLEASPLLTPFPPVESASCETAPEQPNVPEVIRGNPNLSDVPGYSDSSLVGIPSLPSRPSVEPDASRSSFCVPRSSFRRRTGKVARLPIATREKINTMLDDGLPYAEIIKSLGPECAHLNTDNIGNWVKGGYQAWLNLQEKHSFAEDFCHHIDKVDKPDDPDALYEKTLRFTAFHICATLASLPRPNPDKPDYSWTRVTKDVPRLIKSFIDFRYCRDWTNPAAKAGRIARQQRNEERVLNAARLFKNSHPGLDTLCELFQGTIKVNPDGTCYRPTAEANPNLPPAPALALTPSVAASAAPIEVVGTARRSGPGSEIASASQVPQTPLESGPRSDTLAPAEAAASAPSSTDAAEVSDEDAASNGAVRDEQNQTEPIRVNPNNSDAPSSENAPPAFPLFSWFASVETPSYDGSAQVHQPSTPSRSNPNQSEQFGCFGLSTSNQSREP